jgi:hypothetical protein
MEEVGTTQVLAGKFKGEKIWIGCQVDSKHTTLIANTWSTTERTGNKKKRKVGGRLVEFNYCEYQGTWYWIRHAVDDANHNRSHPLPLEDTMKTKEWVCDNLLLSMRSLNVMREKPTTFGLGSHKIDL